MVSILIVYERAKDSNNKDKNLKIRVYYLALKIMLKHISKLVIFCNRQYKLFKAALIEYYKKGIEIFYANSLKHCCFPILLNVIVDYEE